MGLKELKAELKEKEKGCGRLMGFPADNPRVKCGDNCKTIQGKRICGFCKAKIEYLKKGISACKEMLKLKDEWKSEWELEFKRLYNKKLKKAISQRNQEILEIIDHEIEEEMKAIDKKIIRQTWDIVDELRYLKRQLTTNSEGKE